MAGSLVSNWGMYSGFEFCEADWLPPKDEYLHSEKYELKHRDLDAPGNIKNDVRLINRIRRENPAMKDFQNVRFFPAQREGAQFRPVPCPDRPVRRRRVRLRGSAMGVRPARRGVGRGGGRD
jgi:hypothetical protein